MVFIRKPASIKFTCSSLFAPTEIQTGECCIGRPTNQPRINEKVLAEITNEGLTGEITVNTKELGIEEPDDMSLHIGGS